MRTSWASRSLPAASRTASLLMADAADVWEARCTTLRPSSIGFSRRKSVCRARAPSSTGSATDGSGAAVGNHPLHQRQSVGVAALARVELRQIVQRLSRRRDGRDRAPSRRSPATACRAARRRRSDLGRGRAAARLLSDCRDIGMVGTERLLADRQRSLVERLGVGVATLVLVELSQIVERLSRHWDGRGRAPSRRSPALACRAARRRRSGLGLGRAQPDC